MQLLQIQGGITCPRIEQLARIFSDAVRRAINRVLYTILSFDLSFYMEEAYITAWALL